MTELDMRIEETPNPNARRYVLNRPVQEGSKGRFYTEVSPDDEPLVRVLLALEGVAAVMLLPNSVTVNKAGDALWDQLGPQAEEAIRGYFLSS